MNDKETLDTQWHLKLGTQPAKIKIAAEFAERLQRCAVEIGEKFTYRHMGTGEKGTAKITDCVGGYWRADKV